MLARRTMSKHLVAAFAALFLSLGFNTGLRAATADPIDIPYTRFTLPNGLTVIVSEDHKAPVVAVSVWYHVGSADEPDGQDRLRAPVRAPDVPGLGEPQGRVLPSVRAGRRDRPERHDLVRPHQLFRDRADHRARHGAVDGIGPHGPPARRDRPEGARRAARRGAERKAPGREPALRPRRRAHAWPTRSRPTIRTTTTRSAR